MNEDSLRALEAIFERMNPKPSEEQKCFIRSFVTREGVTITGDGRRTPEQQSSFPPNTQGHVITGNINGRDVQIIISDNNFVYTRAKQENGKHELFHVWFNRNGYQSSLTRDAEMVDVGGGLTLRESGVNGIPHLYSSYMVNGVFATRPPLTGEHFERHAEMNGYNSCNYSSLQLPRFTPT
jgi:hypothetical protein